MVGTIGNLFRFIIVGSCSVALVFQLINTVSCTFVSKSSEDEKDTIDFGLWKIGLNEECLDGKYDALHDHDTVLHSARICHITSMIAGAIAMLLVLTECLKCKICCGNKLQGLAFFIAWTTGLAVYSLFGMEGCGNYFHSADLQSQFDNITSVVDLVEKLDSDPKSDFTMDTAMKENINNYSTNRPNITDSVPGFVELIPFGTSCTWGQGASYNLIASLIYIGCGILLCITPKANPIYGSHKEEEEEEEEGEEEDKAAAGHTDLSQENNDLILETQIDNAKIV